MKYFDDYNGGVAVRNAAAIAFGVSIALVGWVMMTLTSSPIAKGAAFLWLPAALQLMAGVWLGPLRGMLAGGLGAYAAGILAYGGWGIPDIIMNPIAGGIMNSMLPAILFAALKIDPEFDVEAKSLKSSILILTLLLASVIALAFFLIPLNIGFWAYAPSMLVLLFAPIIFKSLRMPGSALLIGIIISVVISFLSAILGVFGTVVAGQTIEAAILGTGIGWFLGDTVSCVLGLYALAVFTDRARELGIAPILSE